MSIKNKRDRRGPRKGRTKKIGEHIAIYSFKNVKAVCTVCHTYKPVRFKIEVRKPLGVTSGVPMNHFHYREAHICSKECRTMFLLQSFA